MKIKESNILIDAQLNIQKLDGFEGFNRANVGTQYIAAELDGWALEADCSLWVAFYYAPDNYTVAPLLMAYDFERKAYTTQVPPVVMSQSGTWTFQIIKRYGWNEETGKANRELAGDVDSFFVKYGIVDESGNAVTDADVANLFITAKQAAEESAKNTQDLSVYANAAKESELNAKASENAALAHADRANADLSIAVSEAQGAKQIAATAEEKSNFAVVKSTNADEKANQAIITSTEAKDLARSVWNDADSGKFNGKPFVIARVYNSFLDLRAETGAARLPDYPDPLEIGDYGIIASNTEDPHNSEMYVWRNTVSPETGNNYQFTNDMSGAQGFSGWSPMFAVVAYADGNNSALQLVGWTGGQGTQPTQYLGQYLGANGYVSNILSAINIRGASGATGEPGTSGWAPIFTDEYYDNKIIKCLTGYIGGVGEPPTAYLGQYASTIPPGYTTNKNLATNYKGADGTGSGDSTLYKSDGETVVRAAKIINDLTTGGAIDVLSAMQGKIIGQRLDLIEYEIDNPILKVTTI